MRHTTAVRSGGDKKAPGGQADCRVRGISRTGGSRKGRGFHRGAVRRSAISVFYTATAVGLRPEPGFHSR